ncbi:hypothetical protein [Megasphaera sueciensis]|jgi:hypothetical protein|uniref:hypothetical protein n=1 Tax=Megasphaera sueciensis TaxID=349094 RepID=UPI003D07EB20|nr:hypothetical protein [Megasphaera sp.]
MRAQFFDGFDFAKYKYSIVAIEHVHDFFNIAKFGIHPIMFDESCLRGYSCIFGFNDEKQLSLHKLFTNNNNQEMPEIDGIKPISFHSPAGEWKYELEHPLNYTGSLLIANDFIQKYFVPFGFQLPHAFKKVFELTFEAGMLQHVEDKAEEAHRLRIEYEVPVSAATKVKMRVGHILNKEEQYGFDDDVIEQYMDLSYDTKYLF